MTQRYEIRSTVTEEPHLFGEAPVSRDRSPLELLRSHKGTRSQSSIQRIRPMALNTTSAPKYTA